MHMKGDTFFVSLVWKFDAAVLAEENTDSALEMLYLTSPEVLLSFSLFGSVSSFIVPTIDAFFSDMKAPCLAVRAISPPPTPRHCTYNVGL